MSYVPIIPSQTYGSVISSGFRYYNANYATTAALTAVYANGVAGVGATLTNSGVLAAFSIDGASPALNSRILVKDQASAFQNGIYTLTTVGSGAIAWVLTRATDYDQTSEITAGGLVSISSGTVNGTSSWLETATVSSIGTDPIVYSQFTYPPASFLLKANNLSDVANAATSRTNLGLTIGVNVQAYDANLTTWAAKTVPAGTVVGTTDVQTLTNKTLEDATTFIVDDGDNTKRLAFQCSGISAATTRTLTIQDASGTVAYLSDIPSIPGAALTKTDDTNVTLTLGGAPATALVNAASLTLGWSGQLAPGRGGTGIGSYTIGDLLYASGAATLSKLADVATGSVLISGGVGAAPQWSAGPSVTTLTATTSVLTPTLDANTAGALSIGTTTATSIALKQNVVIDTAKTLTTGTIINGPGGGLSMNIRNPGNSSIFLNVNSSDYISINDSGTPGAIAIGGGKSIIAIAGAGALTLGAMSGDWSMPTGNGTWTGASSKTVVFTTSSGSTLTWSSSPSLSASGSLSLSGSGVQLQHAGTTLMSSTSTSIMQMAAGKSFNAAAGASGFGWGSATGDFTFPTGAISWTGASGKAGNLYATSSTLNLGTTTSGFVTLQGAQGNIFYRAAVQLMDIGFTDSVGVTLNGGVNFTAASGAGIFNWGSSTGNFTLSTGSVSWTGAAAKTITLTQGVATTGSPTAFTFVGGAHTTLTASVEAIDFKVNLARTVQFSSGALATQRAALFQAPTYGFTGGSTLTNAATLAVSGAPIAGTNATITNSHALWIQGGNTQLDGNLNAQGGLQLKRTATATDYNVLTTDVIVGVTSTAAVRTMTLPTAASALVGRTYIIKDESGAAGTNNIVVDGNGAETIDGAATQSITTNYGSMSLYTDGTSWFIC